MLRKQNKIMKMIREIKRITMTTTIKIKIKKFRVTNLLNLTTFKKTIKINFRRRNKINKMKKKIEIVIKISHRQNLTIVFVIHVTSRIILLLISCVKIMRKRKSDAISIKINRRKKKKFDA